MTDDATLSDFGADDRDPEADGTETDGASGGDETATALSTYAWGDYTCRRCENPTERVWRDDGDLVCPACKSW
ncbi:DUF7573 domain-containing protein [Halopiger djelfimassiliensis]|uniref:DUF7573 domain-containing protein n=1 Tax=Halopiger djelfimassiliensis TaxID=1293047 RepID=UPI00067821C4|nr:hypothetical protein [Halopiger djelfimassiliensis]